MIKFLRSVLAQTRAKLLPEQLPPAAKQAQREDQVDDLSKPGPDNDSAIAAAIEWILRAQDLSSSNDGGVARAYDIIQGWQSSYPETTGYIIPTLLVQSDDRADSRLLRSAQRMLDWLVSIQMPSGAFQGGAVGATPIVPVAFNTGQILLGLAAGTAKFGIYRDPLVRAADWLVEIQDSDGKWSKGMSPFALPGPKTYYTHVAWGLFHAARLVPQRGYAEAAVRNIEWSLTHQISNGWVNRCCLLDFSAPLTHTLGYFLRGLIEAYQFTSENRYLEAACRTADGLEGALLQNGFLPGKLRSNWKPASNWACLTGTVQTATCWLLLYKATGRASYLTAAHRANDYVRRTIRFVGDPNIDGAVKGSFPIDGDYLRFQYPNWAAKFLIDSLHLESQIMKNG